MTNKPITSVDDLTVTTATRSEADVRASLGQPADKKPAKDEQAVADEPAADPAGQDDDAADAAQPDPAASDAGRQLAANRLDQRKKRMQGDIDLYEDNLRRLGGTVKPIDKREYKKPQDELDHLARRRHELLGDINKRLREPPTAPPAARPAAAPPIPPARPAAAEQPAATARPAAPAAPVQQPFTFPTWEQWQEKHADKDYTDFLDARQDARASWLDAGQRQAAEHHQRVEAQERAYSERMVLSQKFATATEAFRAEHPDYDQVLQQTHYPPQSHPQAVATVNNLVLRSGEHAPKILYFLGQNADEVSRLFLSPSPADLLQTFGEIKYAALKATGMSSAAAANAAAAPAAPAAPAKPAASAPSRPATSAPAPLSEVRAGAHDTRSLAQVAADTEDADEYIERRKAEQRRSAGRA